MKIFHSIEEYRRSDYCTDLFRSAVTLGKFDGVHIGHTKLIRDITRHSRRRGLISIVFAIETKDGFILSHDERAMYLESLDVDILVECPFSKEFRNMLPEEFAGKVLSQTLRAAYVCVGPDFTFGRDRAGSAAVLLELGTVYGFHTVILEKERIRGEDVSSTRVREALRSGNMKLVEEMLGRSYPILGTVRHGRHLGTGIGYPTVNVLPQEGKILPPDGVYASVTTLPDHTLVKGVTNIGIRPTVGGKERRAETTLIHFHRDLYDRQIMHELLRFIRPEKKFDSLEELSEQIAIDRKTAWG